ELIAAMVAAAVDLVERHTARLLSPRPLRHVCAGFPASARAIVIPRDPITEIVAVSYVAGDGTTVEMADDDWRWSDSAPDQLLPAFGQGWPSAAREPGSVRIDYVAGYEEGLCP